MIIGISGKKQHGKNLLGDIIQYLLWNPNNKPNPVIKSLEDFQSQSYGLKKINSGWEHKSFAYKLKECASIILGLPRVRFETEEGKDMILNKEWDRMYFISDKGKMIITSNKEFADNIAPMRVRTFLQEFGTEVGRNIHPNIWINALFVDYTPTNKTTLANAVEKDFEDEAFLPNWIITDVRFPNEAKAIKERNGLIFRIYRPSIQSEDTHASETALDNYSGFDETIINDVDINELIHKTKAILQKYKIIP